MAALTSNQFRNPFDGACGKHTVVPIQEPVHKNPAWMRMKILGTMPVCKYCRHALESEHKWTHHGCPNFKPRT